MSSHIPVVDYFLCVKCDFVSKVLSVTVQHCINLHKFGSTLVLENSIFDGRRQVYNMHYINPGKYRLAGTEQLYKAIPSKLFQLMPLDKQCLVVPCRKKKLPGPLKEHWNEIHVPVFNVFLCPKCPMTVKHLSLMMQHLMTKHSLGGAQLDKVLMNAMTNQVMEKNTNFIDPVEYRLEGVVPELEEEEDVEVEMTTEPEPLQVVKEPPGEDKGQTIKEPEPMQVKAVDPHMSPEIEKSKEVETCKQIHVKDPIVKHLEVKESNDTKLVQSKLLEEPPTERNVSENQETELVQAELEVRKKTIVQQIPIKMTPNEDKKSKPIEVLSRDAKNQRSRPTASRCREVFTLTAQCRTCPVPLCYGKSFKSPLQFRRHFLYWHVPVCAYFMCSYCDFVDKTLTRSVQHCSTVHGDQKRAADRNKLSYKVKNLSNPDYIDPGPFMIKNLKTQMPAAPDQILYVPVMDTQCPVPECGDQGLGMSIQVHWDMYHTPVLNPYKCSLCQRNFDTQDTLLEHFEVDHGLRSLNAQEALQKSSEQCQERNHLYVDPGPYRLKYTDESNGAESSDFIGSMVQSTMNMVSEQSEVKPDSSSKSEKVVTISNENDGEKKSTVMTKSLPEYTSDASNKSVSIKATLSDELQTLTEDCTTCPVPLCLGKTYLNHTNLRQHFVCCHLPVSSYFVCEECNLAYKNLTKMIDHFKDLHGEANETAAQKKIMADVKYVSNPDFTDPGKYQMIQKVIPNIPDKIIFVSPTRPNCPVEKCEALQSGESLRDHWLTYHWLVFVFYSCTHCSHKFDHSSQLAEHLKKAHSLTNDIVHREVDRSIQSTSQRCFNRNKKYIDPGPYRIQESVDGHVDLEDDVDVNKERPMDVGDEADVDKGTSIDQDKKLVSDIRSTKNKKTEYRSTKDKKSDRTSIKDKKSDRRSTKDEKSDRKGKSKQTKDKSTFDIYNYDKIIMLPDECVTCPVPTCPDKTGPVFPNKTQFRRHFRYYHLPVVCYFLCSECKFADKALRKSIQHSKEEHGNRNDQAIKSKLLKDQRHVSNADFVDPGPYRIGGIKSMFPSAPSRIKYVRDTKTTCPVPECKNQTIYSMKSHWEYTHVPIVMYLVCPNCSKMFLGKEEFSKHLKQDHALSDHRIERILEDCLNSPKLRYQERNVNYIDPEAYRLRLSENMAFTTTEPALTGRKKTTSTSEKGKDAAATGIHLNQETIISPDGEKIEVLSDECTICPVETCKGEIFTDKALFGEHFVKIHVPVSTFYVCPEEHCRCAGNDMEQIIQHCMTKHHAKHKQGVKEKLIQGKKQFNNPDFIDPGPYRIQRLQEMFPSLPDRILFVSPSDTRCPVEFCMGTVFNANVHWKTYHNPMFVMYHCPYCKFKTIPEKLGHHLKHSHSISDYNVKLKEISQEPSLQTSEINVKYLNPGPYRLDMTMDIENKTNTDKQIGVETRDGHVFLFDSCQTCPVPACGGKIFHDKIMFRRHFLFFHIPVSSFFLCQDCPFVDKALSRTIVHCVKEHQAARTAGNDHVKEQLLSNQRHVSNPDFIDPGQYCINGVKSMFPTLPDKILYVSQTDIECPVDECRDTRIRKSMKEHWQQYHTPAIMNYKCFEQKCFRTFDKFQKLCQHLPDAHGISVDHLTSNSETIRCLNRNVDYIDPGTYRLQEGDTETDEEDTASHTSDWVSERSSHRARSHGSHEDPSERGSIIEMDQQSSASKEGASKDVTFESAEHIQMLNKKCLQCPVPSCCGNRFQTYRQFKQHFEFWHVPISSFFLCHHCDFTDKSLLKSIEHCMKQHQTKRRTVEKKLLSDQRHVVNPDFIDPGPYRIPGLRKMFPTLPKKIEYVSPSETKCPVGECKDLTIDGSLDRHWKTHHLPGIMMYKCFCCPQKCDNFHALLGHFKDDHLLSDWDIDKEIGERDQMTAFQSYNKNPSYMDPGPYRLEQTNSSQDEEKLDLTIEISDETSEISSQFDTVRESPERDVESGDEGSSGRFKCLSDQTVKCPVPACNHMPLFGDAVYFRRHFNLKHVPVATYLLCPWCSFTSQNLRKTLDHCLDEHHMAPGDERELRETMLEDKWTAVNMAYIDPGLYRISGQNKIFPTAPDFITYVPSTEKKCPVKECEGLWFEVSLDKHWEECHVPVVEVHKCARCNKAFGFVEELTKHLRVVHGYSESEIQDLLEENLHCFERNASYLDPGQYRLKPIKKDETPTETESEIMKMEDTPIEVVQPCIDPVSPTRDIVYLPDDCVKCPVPDCQQEGLWSFNAPMLFRKHFNKLHIPVSCYFLCPWCSYADKIKFKVIEHALNEHARVESKDEIENLVWQDKRHAVNVDFIDPGPFRIPGTKDFFPSAPDKVVYVSPLASTCPVTECGDAKLEVSYQEHWEDYHMPVIQVFRCPCCTDTFVMVEALKKHLQATHGYRNPKLQAAVDSTLQTYEKNAGYIDPGAYRLMESTAKPSMVVMPKEARHILGSYGSETETEDKTYSFEEVVEEAWKTGHPQMVVIVMRGLPGAGKSRLARFIKVRTLKTLLKILMNNFIDKAFV